MRPAGVDVDDGGLRRRGVLVAGMGASVVIVATAVAVGFSTATLGDLAPFAGFVLGACVCWVLAHLVAGERRRRRDRRAVDAFFDDAIWEHWTYSEEEWRTIVDRDQPEDPPLDEWSWGDHLVTFGGLGLVFATAIVLFGVFGFDDPDVTPIVLSVAGAFFVVMIAVAVAQPFYLRRIHHERRAALLAVADPGVWFGPHAIFHHALGFVRLEPLAGVHDDTAHRHNASAGLGEPSGERHHVVRGDGSVVFTIARPAKRRTLDDLPPIPARVVHVDVPADARELARDLVARYHRGRPGLAH